MLDASSNKIETEEFLGKTIVVLMSMEKGASLLRSAWSAAAWHGLEGP